MAAMTGALVTNAPASSPPSVTGQTSLVGAPNALACNGAVNVRVTLTGTAGVDGNATDIMLVLDLSGSISGTQLGDLKNSAKSFVEALDLARNRAGIVTYQGSSATPRVPLGGTKASLTGYIDGITDADTRDASPHHRGIQAAQTALTSSTNKKALALFTDGQTQQTDALAAATAAKATPDPNIRIATIGIGGGAAMSAMESWATQPDYYQSGSSGFSANELVSDLGAAIAVPAAFTLTETLGSTFTASAAVASKGSVTGTGPLVWTGELLDETATLDFTATRNGSPLFSVTEEDVSTSALTVTGGTGTITPPATKKIEVLPCDAGTLLGEATCTGGSCGAGGTVPSGVQFSLNAGSPPAGTEIFVAGLSSTPPAGACRGFDTNANGVQIDIRPLTTPGNFEIKIPKAALGTKKWWQTDVCVGTNLKFITKIGSLANLRPGALNSGGRWWGLLPSIPRYVNITGLGWVKGPSITHRGPGAVAGDAVIRFTIPYVGENSKNFTTNGLPGYDPRAWGG